MTGLPKFRRIRLAVQAVALLASSIMATATQAEGWSAHIAMSAEDQAGSAEIDEKRLSRELDRFRAATLSLREALGIARKRHIRSRVVDISFDGSSEQSVYRVKTNIGDRIWQDTIDARSGDLVGAGDESSVADLGQSDRQLIVRLRNVEQDMVDAIAVAERSTSGKAVGAGFAMDGGRLQFVVVCVVGSDLKQVLLEPPGAGLHRRK